MGQQGRFGKYGETKRVARLRESGMPQGRGFQARPWLGGSIAGKPYTHKPRVDIREADFSDEGFIRRLSAKVFSVYGPYSEMIRRWLELDTTTTLISLQDGRPAGFVMLGTIERDSRIQMVPELLAIAVEPEKQHMGIGQKLLTEIEKKASQFGEKKLVLHTATGNVAARRLFLKNDYLPGEIKLKFYPRGQDAFMMVKEIGCSE